MKKEEQQEAVRDASSSLFKGMKAKNQAKDVITEQSASAEDPKEKSTGKPFSIWMDSETKKKLKALSTVTGMSISGIVNSAVSDYMSQIELSPEQKTVYDAIVNLTV